ncbi:hypothetical protein TRFO_33841 [Tritrichomonas foetus]|uniref:Uncharacterized protein n=1 Tax=Tritrichomonas foetus TaxID=1144522 RepID=A0A1J4JKR4_9EUKA|nr:hypothetical protein TRFO_33841 [Tritrichomonas foetus]|eukprot:OHS99710.1 hypothetical protein TRFO_33841 [Tritrichomonas foetus]
MKKLTNTKISIYKKLKNETKKTFKSKNNQSKMNQIKLPNHKISAIDAKKNPQNPYPRSKASKKVSSSFTGNNRMPKKASNQFSIQKALPKKKECGFNKINQALKKQDKLSMGKSCHSKKQSNEKYLRHESVKKAFLVNTMTCPLQKKIEQTIQITLKAEKKTLWQDIPTLHMLKKRRLDKAVTHNTGKKGFTFFSREVVKIKKASSHSSYSPEIEKKVAPGKTPMMLFPKKDSNSNVCAVVQVKKDPKNPFFDDEDEKKVQFFIKKFKIYSKKLHLPKIPHETVQKKMQIMQLEQFLLAKKRKITQLFECEN